MLRPKVLILSGDGINCEFEMELCFKLAQAETSIVHIGDLILNPKKLLDFQILAIPGGFSFADDLGSGQILALKLLGKLNHELHSFIERKSPIIGVCNGFQVLTKMGLLPFADFTHPMSLVSNKLGDEEIGFVNQWVKMKINPENKCAWTDLLKKGGEIELPMRHGEGRVKFVLGYEKEIYQKLQAQGQVVLSYSKNVNGSYENIAGICDPSGTIFGLMPHPEAYFSNHLHPVFAFDKNKKNEKGAGALIFESIVNYMRQV